MRTGAELRLRRADPVLLGDPRKDSCGGQLRSGPRAARRAIRAPGQHRAGSGEERRHARDRPADIALATPGSAIERDLVRAVPAPGSAMSTESAPAVEEARRSTASAAGLGIEVESEREVRP